MLELRTTFNDIPFNRSLQAVIHAGSRFPADSPRRALTMGIIIREAGYPIRKSKCWSLLGISFGEVFLDAMGSVKARGVNGFKIIVAMAREDGSRLPVPSNAFVLR